MLITSFIEISNTFNISLSTFHIRSVLFFAFFAITLPLFGALCEEVGPKRQFILGLLLFVVSTIVCSFPISWNNFIIFQCLQAISDSLIVSTMPVLFRLYLPEDKIGWAFGFQSAVLSCAGLIGPPCGAFLTNVLGWQSIYILLAIISSAAGLFAFYVIPKDRKLSQKPEITTQHPFESTLYLLLGFLIIFLLTLLNSLLWLSILLPSLVIILVRLIIVERDEAKQHIIPPNGTKDYYTNLFRALLIYTSSNIIFLFFPTFIRQIYNIGSSDLGIIVALNALVPICFGIYIGKLSDKSPIRVLYFGILIFIVLLFIMLTLPKNSTAVSFLIIYFLIGLASALTTPSQWKITFFTVPKKCSGKHTGLYLMIQFLSGGFASVIYMLFSKYSLENNLHLFHLVLFTCIGMHVLTLLTIFLQSRSGALRALLPNSVG